MGLAFTWWTSSRCCRLDGRWLGTPDDLVRARHPLVRVRPTYSPVSAVSASSNAYLDRSEGESPQNVLVRAPLVGIRASTCPRRSPLRASGVVLGLGVAGCSGDPTADPSISNETATERALAAEESYLTERLQDAPCLAEWGTASTTVSERRRPVGRVLACTWR